MLLLIHLYLQLAYLDDNIDESSFLPMIRFSEWLDEFLCRLFSLLLHLEPSSVTLVLTFSSSVSSVLHFYYVLE